MDVRIENIKIRAIATTVPSYIETNDVYNKALGEKRVRRQTRMTGIEKRHINDKNQKSSDLCLTAANQALEKTGWGKEEIQVLVFVTQTPSVIIPSTSFIIQKQLGLSEDCMVFDVNLGCSGYVAGLQIMASMLRTCGSEAKGLLLVGDVQRSNRDGLEEDDYSPDERADRMLFGSAGSATAVELMDNAPFYFMEKSDGANYAALMQRFHENMKMDGEKIFNFGVNDVIQYIEEFMCKFGVSDFDVDYYVFHQAQKFLLENMASLLGVSADKLLFSLKEYGNTSSASIPITICANHSELGEKKRQKLLLCGFGVGLSCGIAYLELDTEAVLPIRESDAIYEF